MKNIRITGHTGRTALATTVFALCAGVWDAGAQFEITTAAGSAPAQNFNTLASSGTANAFTNDSTLAPGDSTLDGWSLFNFANAVIPTYRADTGTSTNGGIYSYGPDATDRALGGIGTNGLSSGSGTTFAYFAFAATNTSAFTVTSFTLGFSGEQWRNGGNTVAQTMLLEYGFAATFAGVTTWTAPGGTFNWSSPVNTASGAAVDGNVAGKVAGLGGTINGLNMGTGNTLWIRWRDFNEAGNDHGLAIDDVGFSWLSATPPKVLTWAPGTSAWNTITPNWEEVPLTPVAFSTGDAVTFGNTGVGLVDIDAAGVAPGSTTVSHSAGTYTFQGGPINGSGSLNKTGDGTLVLAAAHGFTGGVNLDAGTIEVSNDNQLGGVGGLMSYGGALGGTLRTATSGITSSRTVFVLSGGAFDTNSLNSGLTGGVSITGGTFTKAGAGDLRLSGTLSATGTSLISVTGGTLTLAQLAGQLTNIGLDVVNGDIVLETALRLNVNRGTTTGTGKIKTTVTDTIIAQSGTLLVATIGNDIVLNSTNAAGPFVTHLNTTSGNILTIDGVISGASDINFATAITSGGAGTVVLNKVNTWTGATTFNQSTAGVIKLGISNALPTGTAVTFGTQTGAGPGSLDLNGFNQTIASLSYGGVGANPLNARVTNNSATTDSTLTISGSVSPANPFSGTVTDGTNGFKLTVVKAGTNTITLNGVTTFSTLNVTGGTLNLNAALDTLAGSAIDVTPASGTANLNIGANQTIASLTIGNGGIVTLTPPAAPPEGFFPGEAGIAQEFGDLAGSAAAPVPEPGAGMLLLGGLASLLGLRRRR